MNEPQYVVVVYIKTSRDKVISRVIGPFTHSEAVAYMGRFEAGTICGINRFEPPHLSGVKP